jgi:hypothetical protein
VPGEKKDRPTLRKLLHQSRPLVLDPFSSQYIQMATNMHEIYFRAELPLANSPFSDD